jgi:hypothetical protein
MHWEVMSVEWRAGALKTDWAKPLHDARPMGIEWLAEH